MRFYHKVLILKKLQQVTVIGLGLLGSSITLVVSRGISGMKAAGYSHRAQTRQKARDLGVANVVFDDMAESVADADLVILATPICTFENIFTQIAPALKKGCIVTDVGSTKALVHKWAAKKIGKKAHYVGSHPIAGSEQRGVEFARDDLFYNASCILTATKSTNASAVRALKKFWESLGSQVTTMTPAMHDKILAAVSHLPHATAAALVNASNDEQLKYSGKGFVDTSRVASGPANVWADIFYTNSRNICKGIDRTIAELLKLREVIESEDKKRIETLLEKARAKRAKLIEYKMTTREII